MSTHLDWWNKDCTCSSHAAMVLLLERGRSQKTNEIQLSCCVSTDHVRPMDKLLQSIISGLVFGVSSRRES